MSAELQRYVSLGGRVLLSVIFLLSGLMKVMNWSATAQEMETHGLPVVSLLLALATLVEIVAGLALLLGFLTRLSALVLFLYLIPVTLVMHNFWVATPAAQQNQMFHFLKNLAIMGGLLEFCAVGAGALSLDAYLARTGRWLSPFWPRRRWPV